ncbi:asparaginase domain-containing protein [Eubacteriaceae bacterium ES3]|nr:asparaginase domain-containing protein [Eubacteriaceae bacterium ES3]
MQTKEKILLVLTGGTIGSAVSEHCIDVSENRGDDLISLFKEKSNLAVDFEVLRPFQILSENADPSHWLMLIKLLRDTNLTEYAGILIAHGSDTLPYTAAAISYGLDTPKIPIVLVAANYAIGEPGSNALTNFSSSVSFVINLKLPGVFTLYENSDQKINVHLGTRLQEADWIHDDFQSFGGALGVYNHNGLCCQPLKTNPSMPELYNPETQLVPLVESIKNQIFALRAYPGLDYSCIDLKAKPFRAVLHSLYHCGSGNVTGTNGLSLVEFIRNNPQLDHYMISYKDVRGNLYVSSRTLIDAGAIPLENISFEASLAKLFLAYNQFEMSPLQYMKKEFFHEFVRERKETGYIF